MNRKKHIVDSKGKLFGKFNIIDVMAALFILLVIAVGLKFVYSEPQTHWVNVEVFAQGEENPQVFFEGKTLRRQDQIIAQVIDTTVVLSEKETTSKNMYITLNLSVETKDKIMFFGDNELKINNGFSIDFFDVSLQKSRITDINFSRQKQTKRVTLMIKEPQTETVNTLISSDEIYDFEGKAVGSISEMYSSGDDLYIVADIDCLNIADSLYFVRQEIKKNNQITFEAGDIIISSIVFDIDSKRETVKKDIVVFASELDNNVMSLLNKTSVVKDMVGNEIAKVESLEYFPSSGSKGIARIGMQMLCEEKRKTLFFNGNELKLNKDIGLSFDSFEIAGIVERIGKQKINTAAKYVELRKKRVEPWLAEMLSIGDKEVTDSVVATVTDIQTKPAEMVVVSDTGEVFERENPVYKDITVTLKIEAQKLGESLYFHYNEVKIGKNLYFETDEYEFSGSIASVR